MALFAAEEDILFVPEITPTTHFSSLSNKNKLKGPGAMQQPVKQPIKMDEQGFPEKPHTPDNDTIATVPKQKLNSTADVLSTSQNIVEARNESENRKRLRKTWNRTKKSMAGESKRLDKEILKEEAAAAEDEEHLNVSFTMLTEFEKHDGDT
ncbi:hypothetical protein GQ44DRAFT_822370 [Phaeosphaeriaceae sp. PMI808]|nr:hypothetical protein GQ44DRAFT_822370 [Phaeosphaeriaceae sp. PMI808]